MKLDIKKLLIALAIPLAVGGVAALLTGGGMADYQNLVRPPLSPPGWLFPVVWSILYLLMGYASYRVATSGANPEEIRKALNTPLVLHGGSGLSDDDFRNTIREGIAKVNIFTDLCVAGVNATRDANEKGLAYLDMRNLKVEYIKKAVKNKIELFGSQGKA